MQFPFSIQIGSVSIPLHAVFETMAFFIGFRYFLYLRRKRGDHYSSSSRIWAVIGAIFGAVIGSRLIGILERPYELFSANNTLLYIYSNKTVVGGFLGGLLGVEITKKILGENQSSGDLFTYPMILGLIIGRIGCFSMGVYEETYGIITNLPFGMNLGDGVNRHPVILYEIVFLLLVWTSLKKIQRRTVLNSGGLFKLFMISYLSFRLLIEFIKPYYPVFIGLSTIQLTCLAGLFYYIPYIIQPKKLTTYA